jgi:hypothetical protein
MAPLTCRRSRSCSHVEAVIPDLRRLVRLRRKTIFLALIYVVFPGALQHAARRTAPQLVNALRRSVARGRCCGGDPSERIAGDHHWAARRRGFVFATRIRRDGRREDRIGYLIFEATQQTARTIVGMVVMGLIWLAIDLSTCAAEREIERWGLTVDAEQRTSTRVTYLSMRSAP